MIEENWTSNHFVPLFPITNPDTPVSVEEQSAQHVLGGFIVHNKVDISDVSTSDFYWVTWKGQDIADLPTFPVCP